MKSSVRLAGALVLALFASTSATRSNAQQAILKTKIPFDFTVNDTRMPAGEYTIKVQPMALVLETAGRTVAVQSFESHDESKSGSRLVFYQYDDQYFLHEVLSPSKVPGMNRIVVPSKAEKGPSQHGVPTIFAVR